MSQKTYNNIVHFVQTGLALANADSVDSDELGFKPDKTIGIGIKPSDVGGTDTLDVDLIGQLEEGGDWVVVKDDVVSDIAAGTSSIQYGTQDLSAVPAIRYKIRITTTEDQSSNTVDIFAVESK